MNIRDYILDENVIVQTKEVTPKPNKQNKPEVIYSIEYENDTDFILKRKTPRTERLLVVLISQGQIYFKEKGNIIIVTDYRELEKFFKDLKEPLEFKILTWMPYTRGDGLNGMFGHILDHKELARILANEKFDIFSGGGIWQYCNEQNILLQLPVLRVIKAINPDLFRLFNINSITNTIQKLGITINTIKPVSNILSQFSVNELTDIFKYDDLKYVLEDCHCDFKTFIEYLYYTIKNRNHLGFTWGEFRFHDYTDYLKMQMNMYGKIKEKYPENWLTDHHNLIAKYNAWKEINSKQLFELNQNKIKNLEFEDGVFKVIIPDKSVDILDEANQQKHCVASYIDAVKDGKTHILFIREKGNEQTSLLTVEVTPDNVIKQLRGFQNRYATPIEYDFVKSWAKEKGLKLEV